MLEKMVARKIIHLEYFSWPDKGVPELTSNKLIEFFQKVAYMHCASLNECKNEESKPNTICASCSTGFDNSATFCVINNCICHYHARLPFSVAKLVEKFREENHSNAISSLDQYVFIYRMLSSYFNMPISKFF